MLSLRFLFMLFYTPTACVVGLWKPFWGLLMLVFMYYFRPEIWEAPTWFRPVNWITICVCIGWLAHARTIRFSAIMGVSLMVLLGLLVSAYTATYSRTLALDGVLVVTKVMVVQFLTLQLVTTIKEVNQFIWANVLGMIWNVKTILVLGFFGGNIENAARVDVGVGQGGGANYLAMILVMTIPFFFLKIQTGTRWERIYALGGLGTYLLALIATGSRAGLLALGIVLIYLVLKSNKKFIGLTFGAAAVILVFLLLPQSQKDRFKSALHSETRDFAAESRIMLWKASIDMWRQHKLLGVGLDNFSWLSPRYTGFYGGRSFDPYVPGKEKQGFVNHNTWLQSLSEGGLVVSIPFFSLFIMAFISLLRARRMRVSPKDKREFYLFSVCLTGLLFGLIVTSVFGNHMKIDFVWWYLGLVSAVELVARDRAAVYWRQRKIETAALAPESEKRPDQGAPYVRVVPRA